MFGCQWGMKQRHRLVKIYQVNADMMAQAKDNAIFLHCLPANIGQKLPTMYLSLTNPKCLIRQKIMHAQNAILEWLMKG